MVKEVKHALKIQNSRLFSIKMNSSSKKNMNLHTKKIKSCISNAVK